jgi:chitinase
LKTGLTYILIAIVLTTIAAAKQARTQSTNPIHIFAYYLSGNQDGPLFPQEIDYGAFSDLIHFGINVKADGTVDSTSWGMTSYKSNQMVSYCHAHGVKILVCLGTNKVETLRAAISDANRAASVRNLVAFIIQRGYDGLDIDFEPLEDKDVADYTNFVQDLRIGMDGAKPGLLLTAAVASEPALFANIQAQMDQINLMTYDLSGPWPGFKTWYNAGLYGGGAQKMADGSDYPSVDQMVTQFEKGGVVPNKLGIGFAFYGYVWSGASGPMQSIQGVKVDDGMDYKDIMAQYYRPDRYHWDNHAQAPYLSIDAPALADRKFVSYDDETLCAKKVAYIRQKGLAGGIIWELSGGYRADQPSGKRDLLLQAVKRAWRSQPQAQN